MATRVGHVFALEFAPDPVHLTAARAFVASLADEAGCDGSVVLDLKIAVSEACTNAIRAHLTAAQPAPVRVAVTMAADRIEVEISDVGGGFDEPPVGAEAEAVQDVVRFAQGGMGLGVIRVLFPDARIERNDGPGTTVTLTVPIAGAGDGLDA